MLLSGDLLMMPEARVFLLFNPIVCPYMSGFMMFRCFREMQILESLRYEVSSQAYFRRM